MNDLASGVAFCTDCLGFSLDKEQAGDDRAILVDEDGDHILLAGPGVEDVSSLLDEPRIVFKPGDTLTFPEQDLDARCERLVSRGLSDIQQEQNAEGDRKLVVKALNGYTLVYVMRARRTPEEIVERYARGGEEVEDAIAGLQEADLNLSRGPGEWSIRQIVHHLAESDSLFFMTLKTALAQSGSTVIRNPYDQEHWVEALHYQDRTIEPSLALVKAIRQHVAQILQHIPDYWDRYVLLKFASAEGDGHKITVGDLLTMGVRHLAEHREEIRETRRIHQR